MSEQVSKTKIISATKWSSISEIAAKLINPLINMILVRIISPQAFGIVATVTMVISFVEMITDTGFQKYLIQHDFNNEDEKYKCANVAFWTNLGMSIFLWAIIAVSSGNIAELVGSPGLGNVITFACFQLPLTSFSSIQIALYRRDFNFRILFMVRVLSVSIPFIVTVPLALLGLSYWALITGTLIIQIINTIILTVKSSWKPQFFYDVEILKEMLPFSMWSLIEASSIWLSIWVDSLVIGNALSQYYLGLYKTSTTMVNGFLAIITASIVPVLFSTLSRLQEDKDKFTHIFLVFQRSISILILPLGIGVYLYSDLATQLLLGSQWSEASPIIGLWALTRSIKIVFGDLSSEVYRAKGRPKLSFLAQLLHLVVLVPACILGVRHGFWHLVYIRSWVQMQFILVHFILMKVALDIPVLKTIKNVLPTAISSVLMGFFGWFLQQINEGVIFDFLSILLCAVFYFTILLLFSNIRNDIVALTKRVLPRKVVNSCETLNVEN